MANTTPVYSRIDTNLKNDAESVIAQLGLTPSAVIQMLYAQIALTRSIPFEIKLPYNKPVAAGSLSREELNEELMKGIRSLQNGEFYSIDEVESALQQEFHI